MTTLLAGMIFVLLTAAVAWGEASMDAPQVAAELAALRDQLQTQRAAVEQLRPQADRAALTHSQAQAVRDLVHEVLADADTRATLLENRLTAGYDDHFYVGSDNGEFLMQVYATLQTRYVFNHADQPRGVDETMNGFEQRRTELFWAGHVWDPNLTYRVKLAANRNTLDMALDDAVIGYAIAPDWQAHVGRFKIPFLREFLLSTTRQQTVERSLVNQVFSVGRSQGIDVTYDGGPMRLAAMLHDGASAGSLAFDADRADVAVAGRGEWLVAGEWKQFRDTISWPGGSPGLMLGGAVDVELGETGAGMERPDVLAYTADVSAHLGGWNLFAAFVGQHISDAGPDAASDADRFGAVVQGGIFVIPDRLDIFARYEYLDLDGFSYNPRGGTLTPIADDALNLVTVGANWYLNKHALKVSADVVWALDPLPVGSAGAGLVASPGDDQVSLRAQVQVVF